MTEILNVENLSLSDAMSIVLYDRRTTFQVIESSIGFFDGDLCASVYYDKKTWLVNLSQYSVMVIDKFNLKLLKSLRLKLVDLRSNGTCTDDYTTIDLDHSVKDFCSTDLQLQEYITDKYLQFNLQKLKDPKYSKEHVLKFLRLLVNKKLIEKSP